MRLAITSHVRLYQDGQRYVSKPGFLKLVGIASGLCADIDLCVPVTSAPAPRNFALLESRNIRVCPLPDYARGRYEVAAFRHPFSLAAALGRVYAKADAVWVLLPNYLSLIACAVCLALRKRFALGIVGDWPEVLRIGFEGKGYPSAGRLVAGIHRGLLEAMIRRADLVLTNGKALADAYGEAAQCVLPFYDSTISQGEIGDQVASGDGKGRRMIYVGRLDMKKGLRELLLATAGLLADGLDVRLRLVGDGEARDELKRLCGELGIEGRVEFAGWVAMGEALRKEYQSADCMVMPSYTETGPKVVIEAMAYGLPVVSTAVGFAPVLIEDGKTGYLVPVRDARALQVALRKLLADEPARRQIARAALGRARSFTVEAEGASLKEAFRRGGFCLE